MERGLRRDPGAEKDPDKRSPGWGGGRLTKGLGGREGRKCRDPPLETSRGLELERTEGPWHLDLFVVVNLLEAKV